MKAFSNWDQFEAAKRKQSEKLKQLITLRVNEAGMIYTQTARANAPHKFGHHARNIGSLPNNWHSVRLFANAKYAPYLEFGTGGLVNIPKGWSRVASQFRGKGIKKINLPARPHIIPAFNAAQKYLKKKLAQDIRKL